MQLTAAAYALLQRDPTLSWQQAYGGVVGVSKQPLPQLVDTSVP